MPISAVAVLEIPEVDRSRNYEGNKVEGTATHRVLAFVALKNLEV